MNDWPVSTSLNPPRQIKPETRYFLLFNEINNIYNGSQAVLQRQAGRQLIPSVANPWMEFPRL